MFAESVREQRLMRQGFLLPANEFSEDYMPDWSRWLPPIMRLHRDASTEEGLVKHRFQQLFPFCPLHPDRVAQTPKFLGENLLLNARLGMTAAAASQAGYLAFVRARELGAAAAATAEYTQSLLSDDYLAAWLDRTKMDVLLWGTLDDPHNLTPAPPVATGGWGVGSVWGNATGGLGGGGWGGGWGWGLAAWNDPPVRKPRWFPRHYGYHRMGAVFLPPRPVGWRQRLRRRFTWLGHLEQEWHQQEELRHLHLNWCITATPERH
ncbi:hypothetical protein B0H14DRAFT_3596617 [Mycena olivaceomarginata]|nr:hypothetical protein B0H14DRAFT_3596617 [Mycena olivaceomarginata]